MEISDFTELTLSDLQDNEFWVYMQSQAGDADYKVSKATLLELFGCVPFRVSLTAAQIKTLNSVPIDIPELSAPGVGYAWQVTSSSVKVVAGTVAFDNGFGSPPVLEIAASTLAVAQSNESVSLGEVSATVFYAFARVSGGNNMKENDKIQITSDADSAVGNGTAIVYGLARKITL